MTRKEVIRLAQEAGIIARGLPVGGVKSLEEFVVLVAEKEREEFAKVFEGEVAALRAELSKERAESAWAWERLTARDKKRDEWKMKYEHLKQNQSHWKRTSSGSGSNSMENPQVTDFRKLARGQDCMIRLPDCCNFDPATTVLAHIRMAGITGMSQKAPDLIGAWACSNCHDAVDRRRYTDKDLDFVRLVHFEGMARTLFKLYKMGKL